MYVGELLNAVSMRMTGLPIPTGTQFTSSDGTKLSITYSELANKLQNDPKMKLRERFSSNLRTSPSSKRQTNKKCTTNPGGYSQWGHTKARQPEERLEGCLCFPRGKLGQILLPSAGSRTTMGTHFVTQRHRKNAALGVLA